MSTLRDLCLSRFSKSAPKALSGPRKEQCDKLTAGMKANDKQLVEGVISRADMRQFKGDVAQEQNAIRSIFKTMHFLKFFDDSTTLKIDDASGKRRPCLDTFGDILGRALKHTNDDRDLVVMRHNFVLEDNSKNQWNHTSTFIKSGESHSSGGISIMSKTVGVTTAIAARMVMTGKVP